MASPPKSPGDELPAVDWNIVRAGREAARPTTSARSATPPWPAQPCALAAVAHPAPMPTHPACWWTARTGIPARRCSATPPAASSPSYAGGLEIGGVTIAPHRHHHDPHPRQRRGYRRRPHRHRGAAGHAGYQQRRRRRRRHSTAMPGPPPVRHPGPWHRPTGNVRISSGDGAGGIVFIDKASRVIARISATGQASGFGVAPAAPHGRRPRSRRRTPQRGCGGRAGRGSDHHPACPGAVATSSPMAKAFRTPTKARRRSFHGIAAAGTHGL